MPKHRAYSGFTLIELSIVVLVVGILAAMALPSFLDQVRKARRADAMDALEKVQLEQAKFRANCPHYADGLANVASLATCAASNILWPYWDGGTETSAEQYYTIDLVSAATTTFSAKATATGKQASDTDCTPFLIDQDGPVVDDSNRKCWRR
jgi:type IV pilus assembly protein PilE